MEAYLYISSAVRSFGPSDLEAILTSARKHNARTGVTGMLLYADGSFAQLLEGETAALDETLARIKSDRRHTGMIPILREAIAARSFPDWSMGGRMIGPDDPVPGRGGMTIRERLDAASPGDMVTFLRSFYTTSGL